VVVGAGPNGLAAAITIAREGRSVLLVEGADTVGGGCRTAELTLTGFRHDVCSTSFPLGVGSPFFRTLPLDRHGLRWIQPEVCVAHPIDPERAALLHHDLAATAAGLGPDGDAYRDLIGPLVERWDQIEEHVLGPLVRLPRHPLAAAGFGLLAVRSAEGLARRFSTEQARALLAGCAAHSFLPLDRPTTGGFAVLYPVLAHRYGWPLPAGGAQRLSDALAGHLRELGGEIETGRWVRSLSDLPPARAVLLDVTPTQLAEMADLPDGYLRRVRAFRYGPAAFKLDLAVEGGVPWTNPELARAGTVHLGGTFEEVAEAEARTWAGSVTTRPFLLVAQPSTFDPSRAPEGHHTVWCYAHVPHGSPVDYTETILTRLEEYAPGLRERVVGSHVIGPPDWPRYNPNYVGGDIAGGAHTLTQLLFRPFPSRDPYATPLDGVFLCSSSTPPGAGVHGMCGHLAARRALAGPLR
jgi:phytoene dehydrogenase-like protein